MLEPEEPVEKTPLHVSGPTLFCRLGFHTYEKEPGKLYYLRDTGFNILFMTGAIQVGIKRCLCCGKEKFVKRHGLCGLGGGDAGKWRKCSATEAEKINSSSIL